MVKQIAFCILIYAMSFASSSWADIKSRYYHYNDMFTNSPFLLLTDRSGGWAIHHFGGPPIEAYVCPQSEDYVCFGQYIGKDGDISILFSVPKSIKSETKNRWSYRGSEFAIDREYSRNFGNKKERLILIRANVPTGDGAEMKYLHLYSRVRGLIGIARVENSRKLNGHFDYNYSLSGVCNMNCFGRLP